MTDPKATPPVPGWLRNFAILVFLAGFIHGAEEGRIEEFAVAGILTLCCLAGLERLRKIAGWGLDVLFGDSNPDDSIPGDFEEPLENEGGEEKQTDAADEGDDEETA
jgi:hypothetical protein